MKSLDQHLAGGSRFSVNFLKRLKLWQKFTLLGVVVVPATTLLKLTQLAQQHRGVSAERPSHALIYRIMVNVGASQQ